MQHRWDCVGNLTEEGVKEVWDFYAKYGPGKATRVDPPDPKARGPVIRIVDGKLELVAPSTSNHIGSFEFANVCGWSSL